MFEKLRRQLTWFCTISVGLLLAGMAIAFFFFSGQQIHNQAEQTFYSSVDTVLFHLRGQPIIDHQWLSQTEAANQMFIDVEIEGDSLFYTSLNKERLALTKTEEIIKAQKKLIEDRGIQTGDLEPQILYFIMRYEGGDYRVAVVLMSLVSGEEMDVSVVKNMAGENRQIQSLGVLFFGILFSAVVLLSLFAWVFTGRVLLPVEQSRRKQTEFVSAASHELRSPLAVIRAAAGTIRIASPQKTERFLEKIEDECQRLSRLIGDLLQLAEVDGKRWMVVKEKVDAQTLILSVTEGYELLAHEKGILIDLRLPASSLPSIQCDRQRIEQILSILLENALSYAIKGGKIQISAEVKKEYIFFFVEDNGPGIPEAEKKKIFDRFYRADSSRTEGQHYGLGLSIALEIAKLHDGALWVEDSLLGGARFVLEIPIGE